LQPITKLIVEHKWKRDIGIAKIPAKIMFFDELKLRDVRVLKLTKLKSRHHQWRIYKGDWGGMSPGPEGKKAH
jgi:hypothetical protein